MAEDRINYGRFDGHRLSAADVTAWTDYDPPEPRSGKELSLVQQVRHAFMHGRVSARVTAWPQNWKVGWDASGTAVIRDAETNELITELQPPPLDTSGDRGGICAVVEEAAEFYGAVDAAKIADRATHGALRLIGFAFRAATEGLQTVDDVRREHGLPPVGTRVPPPAEGD